MIKLQDKIIGEDCFVLALGPSMYTLEDRIEDFKDKNIVYCGVNHFPINEKHVLSKVGKVFDIVYMVNSTRMRQNAWAIQMHIDRGGLFITSNEFEGALIEEENPAAVKLNATAALTYRLVKDGANRVFIFGMDGCPNEHGLTFHQDEFQINKSMENEDVLKKGYLKDARNMDMMKEWIDKDKVFKVFNVNPASLIDTFKKISIDECLEML